MKNLFILLLFSTSIFAAAQNKKVYNPEDNARQKIDSAVSIAKKEHKFVLLQAGGNWCVWCLRFNKLSQETPELKKILDDNYVVYHLNYSNENKNEDIFSELGFPQRFGFPVFIILNHKGEKIHTQQSDYLEDEGTGYDLEKVERFLEQWSPKVLGPNVFAEK
jgi:thioredoxin-related protein